MGTANFRALHYRPLAWALVAGQSVASSHSQEARDWANRPLQEQRQQQQQQFDRE